MVRVFPAKYVLFALITIVVTSKTASANAPYLIGTYPIPDLVENASTGILIDAANEISRHSETGIKIVFEPLTRIRHSFRQKRIIGYFPELDDHAPPKACKSSPIGFKRIYAFWRKESPEPKNIRDLEGNVIGVVNEFVYGANIVKNPNIALDLAPNDEVNVRKLLSGRVDYIVGDDIGTIAAIRKTDANRIVQANLSNVISALPVFFVFQDDETGRKACRNISLVIDKVMQNGGFKNYK